MSDADPQDMTEQTETIEVDADVYQRFEEAREQTKNEYLPEMKPTTFLSSLLDTQEAVREGYYDDDE